MDTERKRERIAPRENPRARTHRAIGGALHELHLGERFTGADRADRTGRERRTGGGHRDLFGWEGHD